MVSASGSQMSALSLTLTSAIIYDVYTSTIIKKNCNYFPAQNSAIAIIGNVCFSLILTRVVHYNSASFILLHLFYSYVIIHSRRFDNVAELN